MKAAYEKIESKGKLVWAVADTYREARMLASKRATSKSGVRVPPDYFDVCDARDDWGKKCTTSPLVVVS
jgi:hypothetical protein